MVEGNRAMSDRTEAAKGGQRGEGSKSEVGAGSEACFVAPIEPVVVSASLAGGDTGLVRALVLLFLVAGGIRGDSAESGFPSAPSICVDIESYATVVLLFVLRFVTGAAVDAEPSASASSLCFLLHLLGWIEKDLLIAVVSRLASMALCERHVRRA